MDAIRRTTPASIGVSHAILAGSFTPYIWIRTRCFDELRTWISTEGWHSVLQGKELDQRFAPGLTSFFRPLPTAIERGRVTQLRFLPAPAGQIKQKIH